MTLGSLGAQSWSEGLALFPDTGSALWAIALIGMLTGVLRLIVAIHIKREKQTSTVPRH